MRTYSLSYTDECGTDIEHDFNAVNDVQATALAASHISGSEGLYSGITLVTEEGEVLEPTYGWH